MSDTCRCPECGVELPTEATGGLCPRCLFQAAMDSHDAAAGEAGSGGGTPPSRSFAPPDPATLAPHFPQLEILELLGHGGMGAVYKARQKKLDRFIALKVIRPESADDPAFAERFNREARTLARLNHPHIVGVHDFGEVTTNGNRLYYFVMEYVDGPNLRQMLETGSLQPAAALAIVPQICAALQYAHDEGVVHRDIKPENILLDRKGRVKIADFGLAKLSLASPEDFTLTATHQVMGTPRYMAPEQMAGSHAVDHRADIYSLGVVFYEMLTGELPMGHFAPPSRKSPTVDARLDDVVLRALASEPERRYQQASELETDLALIAARDSESHATLSAGAANESRPGVSSLLEQNVAAAAGWLGGHTPRFSGSGSVAVDTATVARRLRGPGIALMLYGLVLLLPAAFLMLNGYDIADGNDSTWWGHGVGLIIAGLAIVGVCGLLLRGGWHMLALEKYQPALLASFIGQPIGLWGLLVLGRGDVKAAFRSSLQVQTPVPRATRATQEVRGARQMVRGLGCLLVCVNLFALAIGFVVAHANDVSLDASFSFSSPLEYHAKQFVWRSLLPFVLSPYILIPLGTLVLSVGGYVFVAGYLKARHGSLVDPADTDEIRRDLHGPSTGLIVTGLANWIGIPLVVVALSGAISVSDVPEMVVVLLALASFLAAAVMIAAGILMKRLRAWRFAIVASVLAMVINPGSLVGLPIGIWSLVVLTQTEVRDAFRRRGDRPENRSASTTRAGGLSPHRMGATEFQPAVDRDSALKLVQNPAVGLFIAGLCYWITIPLGFGLWTAGAFGEGVWLPHSMWWFLIMQPAVAGTLLMFGGLRMKRLEGYPAAVTGAVTPILVLLMNLINVAWMDSFGFGPGDLVGPPMGLWALAVLSRADVRLAFWRATSGGQPVVPNADGRAWLPLIAILLLAAAGLIVLTAAVGRRAVAPSAAAAVDIPVETSSANPLTGLSAAAASGDVVRIRQLLDAGASINQKAADGQTPLMKAVANGHRSLALTFILLGADVSEQDHRGRTAVMLAVEQRDTTFLQRLREIWEVQFVADERERQARLGGLSGVDRTLLAGRDFDVRSLDVSALELIADNNGETPSLKAARAGDWECFDLVSTHMDSLLARDRAGRNVVMHAAVNGHSEWFERLENKFYFGKAGVDNVFTGQMLIFDLEQSLSILDNDGKSAWQLAEDHEQREIADILGRHLQAIIDEQTAIINAGGEPPAQAAELTRIEDSIPDDKTPAERVARAYRIRRLAWRALGEHERAQADFLRANE